MTTSSPIPAKAWRLPLVQHPAHGVDGGTLDGSCFPAPAGAPVGALRAKAAALLYAARWGSAQRGAARLLAGHCAKSAGTQHCSFSVDAGVCIEAHDGAALERLLRHCARPPFAMERLRKEGATLVCPCTKQRSEPTNDKRGAKVDELQLGLVETAMLLRCGMALRPVHAACRTSRF